MLQKIDFIERLAAKGYTKKDATIVTDDFILTLSEILTEGDSGLFHGLGKLEVKERSARERICPKTKERLSVPAYKAPSFTAGKSLKRAVREGLMRT